MTVAIDLGTTSTGKPVRLDLEELLSTRLLVQGNSGSGKSHLLRRLLEQSAPYVQQTVIDPEGDFIGLAERFGHLVVDAERTPAELERIAERVRRHRASVVFNCEGLDIDAQMRSAGAFLSGLFEADREHWYPMLVVVDEAQLFAPVMAGEFTEEARRVALGAMTNLMCRGRKRGLAGVIATQRLAKLAKNVAAEASNFLMGRTFLDIDMARAADLLGMDRRQAESFRDLDPGQFVALGPAISRRPLPVYIGPAETAGRNGRPTLMPLPELPTGDLEDLIFAAPTEAELVPRPPRPAQRPTSEILTSLAALRPVNAPPPDPEAEAAFAAEREAIFEAILNELLADAEAQFRPAQQLYQDFLIHCRIRRAGSRLPDVAEFTRRLAVARAGLGAAASDSEEAKEAWRVAGDLAGELPADMQGVFLLIARAAIDGTPAPSDAAMARAYGSHSPARGRRVLAFMEDRGLVTAEIDFRGNRVVYFPSTGWRTAPGDPKAPADVETRAAAE